VGGYPVIGCIEKTLARDQEDVLIVEEVLQDITQKKMRVVEGGMESIFERATF
jgi:hypothetical protein